MPSNLDDKGDETASYLFTLPWGLKSVKISTTTAIKIYKK